MPFDDSPLAHYISSKDAIYRRNVHAAFGTKNLLPDDHYSKNIWFASGNSKRNLNSMSQNEIPKEDAQYPKHSKLLYEYNLLNECISNYINFAMETLQIPVYRVECLEKKGTGQGKNKMTYYFCESLLMGQEISLQLAPLIQNKKTAENYNELFGAESTPRFLELEIKYVDAERPVTSQISSNMTAPGTATRAGTDTLKKGGPEREYTTISKKVARLGLYSIPPLVPHDMASQAASPFKPILMSILDFDAYKLRNTMAQHQKVSKNPKILQQQLYHGLYTTAYVSEVEISAKGNGRVYMMIDGRLFGDFGVIRITPVVSKDKKRLVLNLKTFLHVSSDIFN
jgi:hypothetical protein